MGVMLAAGLMVWRTTPATAASATAAPAAAAGRRSTTDGVASSASTGHTAPSLSRPGWVCWRGLVRPSQAQQSGTREASEQAALRAWVEMLAGDASLAPDSWQDASDAGAVRCLWPGVRRPDGSRRQPEAMTVTGEQARRAQPGGCDRRWVSAWLPARHGWAMLGHIGWMPEQARGLLDVAGAGSFSARGAQLGITVWGRGTRQWSAEIHWSADALMGPMLAPASPTSAGGLVASSAADMLGLPRCTDHGRYQPLLGQLAATARGPAAGAGAAAPGVADRTALQTPPQTASAAPPLAVLTAAAPIGAGENALAGAAAATPTEAGENAAAGAAAASPTGAGAGPAAGAGAAAPMEKKAEAAAGTTPAAPTGAGAKVGGSAVAASPAAVGAGEPAAGPAAQWAVEGEPAAWWRLGWAQALALSPWRAAVVAGMLGALESEPGRRPIEETLGGKETTWRGLWAPGQGWLACMSVHDGRMMAAMLAAVGAQLGGMLPDLNMRLATHGPARTLDWGGEGAGAGGRGFAWEADRRSLWTSAKPSGLASARERACGLPLAPRARAAAHPSRRLRVELSGRAPRLPVPLAGRSMHLWAEVDAAPDDRELKTARARFDVDF